MNITPEHSTPYGAPERPERHLELVPTLGERNDYQASPESQEIPLESLDVVLGHNAKAAAEEFLRYDPHKALVRTIRTTTAVTEGWCIPGQTPSFIATYLSTEGQLAGVPQGSYEASWLALATLHNDDLAALNAHLDDERTARRYLADFRAH